jgi:hypothetical protein
MPLASVDPRQHRSLRVGYRSVHPKLDTRAVERLREDRRASRRLARLRNLSGRCRRRLLAAKDC